MDIIQDTKVRVARKEHRCCASEWLDGIEPDQFTFTEKKAIAKARRNNWRILKGESYVHQVNIWEGQFNDYKAIPSINDICRRHHVFEEN
jgi:hypothetical protein